MKKLLVVAAIVAFVVAFAVPACAVNEWVYWGDDFDHGVVGSNIAGNRGWVQCGGTVSASPQYSMAPTYDGISWNNAALQPWGRRSAMKRDLTHLAEGWSLNDHTYYSGYITAWIYDPYPTNSTGVLLTSQVDTRVGMISNTGSTQGDSGAMTYVMATGITDTRGPYWTAYASSGSVVMNGTGTGTGLNTSAGYTLTTAGYAPAPRRPYAGWNELSISWYGDPVANTMSAYFYINIDWQNPQPNAHLECNATGPRYRAIESFSGLFVGSPSTFGTNAWVDDIEFAGVATNIPEPSSILALGAGVLGLMGLIRRRK